ncbi:hypothetical protein [Hahella ganghwensis]|uniref:hypothetical protein n=1 Tax=Hahella ganghwensis TaxID=286420 RepID=UPI000362F268|nr:hypothetical protein [Hahella ganghwensis]
MKSEILELLARGAKNEVELAAFFGSESMPLVMHSIEEMMDWGLVSSHGRQIHEGNNVFHWEREFILRREAAA